MKLEGSKGAVRMTPRRQLTVWSDTAINIYQQTDDQTDQPQHLHNQVQKRKESAA